MCLPIQKKHYKAIIVSAIAIAIVAQVIHTLGAFATMSYYLDPAYFPVWSKIMMPGTGAPPATFFILTLAASFITRLIYAAAYSLLIKSIPGKTTIQKGLNYGLGLFLVSTLPYTLSLVLLINLPIALIVEWATESLAVSLLAGAIIAKLVK